MKSEDERIRLELMKHVERSVRPVVAPEYRKLAMRQELLSHLSALVERERAGAAASDGAIDRAAARLGEPAELTASLQTSVSPAERRLVRRYRFLFRREGESAVRHGLRVSLLAGLPLGLLIGATGTAPGVVLSVIDGSGEVPPGMIGLRWLPFAALATMILVFSYTVLGVEICRRARKAPGNKGAWAVLFKGWVLSVVCWRAFDFIVGLARPDHMSGTAISATQWIVSALVAPLLMFGVPTAMMVVHLRGLDPWLRLDIGEGTVPET